MQPYLLADPYDAGEMADKLMQLLNVHVHRDPDQVLEIGCCTGLLTTIK